MIARTLIFVSLMFSLNAFAQDFAQVDSVREMEIKKALISAGPALFGEHRCSVSKREVFKSLYPLLGNEATKVGVALNGESLVEVRLRRAGKDAKEIIAKFAVTPDLSEIEAVEYSSRVRIVKTGRHRRPSPKVKNTKWSCERD